MLTFAPDCPPVPIKTWSALGQPELRRPPPRGRAFLVPVIPGGCLVQYLVALERPWPSRAPAAASSGPGLPVLEIRGGCLVQYLVALERPWPSRAPAAAPRGPGLPGTRDPGRVPGAVPGCPGAPLANPITGGHPQGGRACRYPRSGACAWCSTWSPWSALGQPELRRPPPGEGRMPCD